MIKLKNGLKAINSVIEYNNLSKNNRSITFYSEGENYWLHLKGLLISSLKNTKKLICYVSSSTKDPGLKVKHKRLKTFFIGDGFVRDYFFKNQITDLMIMTMPDLDSYQIKRSKYDVHYVYVQHSLVSLHMIYRHGAFNNFDTICAAGPHHVREIKAIEKKYNLSKKNIIKHGYSRLDNLIEMNKNNKKSLIAKKPNDIKILIAPSWGPMGIIESGLCKLIIKELINLNYDVILRPHPQTIKFFKNKVREIVNDFCQSKKLTFEFNINELDSFSKSDIMITDWSGVAMEYAFVYKKPIIYCDVPKKINNKNYLDIELIPLEISIREKIGIIWDCTSPLQEAISTCIKSSKVSFDMLARKNTFNVGRSDKVFVEFIESFQNFQE